MRLSSLDSTVLLEAALLALVFPLALAFPVSKRWIAAWERFAARRWMPLIAVALGTAVCRLAVLPWYPIPVPEVPDEFSLLLGAKTFALGRLTNPAHLFWPHFQALHILQQPTYASIYPPSQALLLALGVLAGNPWFAVLACQAALCAAFVWMLRPWFSPGWALTGGVLLFSRTFLSYWSDSYWGGSLAALAAALMVGAAGRIWFRDAVRWREGWILGAGAVVLLNRRPLEGLAVTLGIGVMLGYWIYRRCRRPVRIAALRLGLPLLAVIVAAIAWVGYYDWRVTGDPWMSPYVKGFQTYMAAKHLLFLPAAPEPVYPDAEFQNVYHGMLLYYYDRRAHFLPSLLPWLAKSWRLYLGPSLVLPLLLAIPWIARSRKIRPIVLILAACLAVNATETWLFPHYVAPELPLLWICVLESLVALAAIGSKWGRALAAASIVSCALATPGIVASNMLRDIRHSNAWGRTLMADRLAALPGRHLVIVKYLPDGAIHPEWVYNEPDIEAAHVVWARDLGEDRDRALIGYFSGRQLWEVEVSESGARVSKRPPGLPAEF